MEKYIKEYLLKYGRVQVTEFGLFETAYKSSYIHPILHTFSVPGKYIVFSENKNQDDDFAFFVSKKEKITIEEAKKRIEAWVAEVWKTIKEEKKPFEVCTLGSFFLNAMDRIEFAAVLDTDISPDSFGLEGFKAELPASEHRRCEPVAESNTPPLTPPTLRLRSATKEGNLESDVEKENSEEDDLQPKKKKKRVGLWILLILLLLSGAFFGTVYFAFPDAFAEYKEKGLVLFDDVIGKFTKNDADNTIPAPVEEVTITEEPQIESDPVEIVEQSPQTQIQSTVAVSAEYGYYVIIGSFRESANADKFLKEKQANYINAVNLGLGKSGYYLVGIGPYSQPEAESKQKEIPNAWIFKK